MLTGISRCISATRKVGEFDLEVVGLPDCLCVVGGRCTSVGELIDLQYEVIYQHYYWLYADCNAWDTV